MPRPQFVWYHEDVCVYPDGRVSPAGYWADISFDDGMGIYLDGRLVGEYDKFIETVTQVIGEIIPETPHPSTVLHANDEVLTHLGQKVYIKITFLPEDDPDIKNGCRYEVTFGHLDH